MQKWFRSETAPFWIGRETRLVLLAKMGWTKVLPKLVIEVQLVLLGCQFNLVSSSSPPPLIKNFCSEQRPPKASAFSLVTPLTPGTRVPLSSQETAAATSSKPIALFACWLLLTPLSPSSAPSLSVNERFFGTAGHQVRH